MVEQVLRHVPHDEAYFWGTHQGAELDLLLRRGDRLYGVECKRIDAPRVTRSIRVAWMILAWSGWRSSIRGINGSNSIPGSRPYL